MRNIGSLLLLHHQTMFLAGAETGAGGFLSKLCPLSPPAGGDQGPEKGSGNGVLGEESLLPSISTSDPSGPEKSPR